MAAGSGASKLRLIFRDRFEAKGESDSFPRLEAAKMRKQWPDHAQPILRNRENPVSKRPDYAAVRADLDAELRRVSAQPGSP